jgi:hypothetical protein
MVTLAMAHPSVSILMDSKGNVYYSDLSRVLKIDPQGGKTVVVRNVHTHELYLDVGDNLYGEHLWYNGESTDTWGHYVWKLSPEGKLEKIIPYTEGFRTDFSFVRDMQGRMYWVDQSASCQKITRKNTDGSLTTLGDQCLGNIRWMTCTSNGTLYLIDHHDLKKIDRKGHVTTLAEHLPDKKLTVPFVNPDHYLSGISTDQAENVYVADYSGRQVKKITPTKQVTVTATTHIPWSPAGTLIAPNGDFWLLECSVTNEVRVEKITPDGKRTVY